MLGAALVLIVFGFHFVITLNALRRSVADRFFVGVVGAVLRIGVFAAGVVASFGVLRIGVLLGPSRGRDELGRGSFAVHDGPYAALQAARPQNREMEERGERVFTS